MRKKKKEKRKKTGTLGQGSSGELEEMKGIILGLDLRDQEPRGAFGSASLS